MSEWSAIELWVLHFLRVPPEPEPPEGSQDSIQVFHAGRNFYAWCLLVWAMSHVAALALLIAFHFIITINLESWPGWAGVTWRIVEPILFALLAGSAFLTFFSQRLNYRLRWYMVTDRSLRIRKGILTMEELTMTFSNIQEIRVTAGPLQNLLKLADVEVHSAGGGTGGKNGGKAHMGCFEGVSNANAIRDLMVERLRQYRDSGLGDAYVESHPQQDNSIEAALEVLAEARALHKHLVISRPDTRSPA